MFDSDENFVEFGTALEPLEEEEVPKKKPVNIADQIVVDENGRRRFHGAFTGGFSAGYYNTVGSKEGWEPSTFKSTRSDRFTNKNQNVQDFMDEEDMGAFGIAPQMLRTTGDFDKKESRKRAKAAPSDGPIPGEPVLDMIIQPVRDTVGIRILQRMGWKPGQGVGPRIYREENTKQKKKGGHSGPKDDQNTFLNDATIESVDLTSKVYGCSLPPGAMPRGSEEDEQSSDSEFDFDGDHMFAPKDLESPLCNPKENTYGLGYTGLDRNALTAGHGHIDLFGSELKFRVENKKLNIRGEAFGVGAFEDDDEEVYCREDISQYDFALETMDERKSRLTNEKMMKKTKSATDGSIPGFTRAKEPQARRKYFPPPTLPKDFEPIHSKRKSRFQQAPDTKEEEVDDTRKHGLDRHKLTVEERQALLGEAKGRISSEKLDTETAGFSGDSKAEQLQKAQEKSERLNKFAEVLQAYSSNKVNQVDSLGRPAFKPFMKNPEKQDRYDKYMTLVAAGYKECLHDLQPLDMTEWQREREKMEFERASALYKPISEVMSSRFVSAQSHDISHVVPIKEVKIVKDPTQDPKVAAKMNLFGKLTHQVLEWHPDRLLCKRLNVPHPYPESKMVGVRNVSSVSTSSSTKSTPSGVQDTIAAAAPVVEVPVPVIKKSLFDNLDFSKPPPGLLPPPQVSSEPPPPGTEDDFPSSSSAMQIDVPQSGQEVKEPETNSNSKPPIDLFKEIFADSSSESEDEVPKPKSDSNSKSSDNINIVDVRKSNYTKRFDQTSTEKNTSTRNSMTTENETSSQIKGIRHQKDGASNSRAVELSLSNNNRKESTEIKNKEIVNNAEVESESEEDIYGPKPPTSSQPSTTTTTIPSKIKFSTNRLMKTSHTLTTPNKFEEDEVEWVEKGKSSSSFSSTKKSSKSSHHHRHHKTKKSKDKHKSKHKSSKSKKEKRRKSTSKHSSKSKSRSRKGSDDEDDNTDGEDSSSSSSSPVQIHQSLSNKALLSKLKELTR